MPTSPPVFDGHNDVVQHLLEYREGGRDFLLRNPEGHLDLPRAREGGLIGGLFALMALPPRPPEDDLTITSSGYEVRLAPPLDPGGARAQVLAQLAALEHLERRAEGQLRIVRTSEQLAALDADGPLGMVVHLEGADAIDADFALLYDLHARGLRSLGLVWSRPNRFGHGVPFAYPRSPDTGPGLTPDGKALVRACNRLGVMIDVSHLNERGFWDVARLSDAPLVATHSNAHAVCPSTRNLTDDQLGAVRESEGVVGFNFAVNDVRPDAHLDPDTNVEVLVRHVDYLLSRLGVDGVALGSDFDGAVMPRAVADASHLPTLLNALRTFGYDEDTLGKLASGNWRRVLRRTWRDEA
ncbi:dipeptidase [Deinococcus yavapaiensis]|uniref:Membrane dipeptidase n=1 Tax=Deinococcus yavapaiensis KR-236 TaxID=694435 RepID=A0A318SLN1_9DEIO|nr:dipeptidase [Deinococcus yavapaiensis]PYE55439.1 membrane dipeptidase [Deinococcus yavapaiensis KR-236]